MMHCSKCSERRVLSNRGDCCIGAMHATQGCNASSETWRRSKRASAAIASALENSGPLRYISFKFLVGYDEEWVHPVPLFFVTGR